MNKDYERRDEILAPYFTTAEYRSSRRHFEMLPLSVFETLMDEGFLERPEFLDNHAPTPEEFYNFAQLLAGTASCYFSGEAVAVTDIDYGIRITELRIITDKATEDFSTATRLDIKKIGKTASLIRYARNNEDGRCHAVMWWN